MGEVAVLCCCMSLASNAVNIKECATSSNLSVLCLYAHRWALGDRKPSTAKCTEMLCSFLKFHPASESVYLTFFSLSSLFFLRELLLLCGWNAPKCKQAKYGAEWRWMRVPPLPDVKRTSGLKTIICFKKNIIWYFWAIWWFNEHRWMWDEFLGDKCLMYLLRLFQD